MSWINIQYQSIECLIGKKPLTLRISGIQKTDKTIHHENLRIFKDFESLLTD
ncbi:hypothetical protein BN938_2336 [Mucinivorans hirudinis]|uniref:Uncharacterized protein n=1 Tax=Mucinivorans hirudinis TaxID=1433126 RepID=A0A060RDQ6_9BACT|nr:hypothetical protein BN938_2336 [Mucinivorans hirudinis]